MEKQTDYTNSSLEELTIARERIDAQAQPEQAALLDRLIAEKTPATRPARARTSRVTFHGNASEYFSIWIVNLLLTIVTLGIYSAWAKVRTNRYFYANLEVDGHRFSYLAEPLQILKGRIIGLLLFAAYFLLGAISPVAAAIFMLVLLIATPFLICQSLKFNLKMTGYRNIRFGFNGNYIGALLAFVVYPILSVFTLYLAFPWVLKKMDEFIVTNMRFGNNEFDTDITADTYYGASFGAVLIAIGLAIVSFLVVGVSVGIAGVSGLSGQFDWTALVGVAAYVLVFLVASSYYQAKVRNHLFAESRIVDVAYFNSELQFGSLAMLKLTNMLALMFTLGLAMPWVKVRSTRFIADATEVKVLSGADKVMVDPQQSASAVGEEVADVFDIDVAIG